MSFQNPFVDLNAERAVAAGRQLLLLLGTIPSRPNLRALLAAPEDLERHLEALTTCEKDLRAFLALTPEARPEVSAAIERLLEEPQLPAIDVESAAGRILAQLMGDGDAVPSDIRLTVSLEGSGDDDAERVEATKRVNGTWRERELLEASSGAVRELCAAIESGRQLQDHSNQTVLQYASAFGSVLLLCSREPGLPAGRETVTIRVTRAIEEGEDQAAGG